MEAIGASGDLIMMHPIFTDFPMADYPALPDGFEDASWCNDACPSMFHEARALQIFVDYVDPSLREISDGPRFHVLNSNSRTFCDCSFSSDSWDEVLAW